MASKSNFQNEDPTVTESIRITAQLRADEVRLDVRLGSGVIFPQDVVLSKKVKRRAGSSAEDTLTKLMEFITGELPRLLDPVEDAEGEAW